MNTLDFEITPNPAFNDHQIRFLVDGEDWLSDGYLGIDPPEFFAQNNILSEGYLLIGRCGCGFVGCADYYVKVERNESKVIWTSQNKNSVEFRTGEYDSVIESAKTDTSWEDTKRTAERLISQVFIGTSIEGGYKFDWASARTKKNTITLSFSHNGMQKLIEFSWDEKSVENALVTAQRRYIDITKQVSKTPVFETLEKHLKSVS